MCLAIFQGTASQRACIGIKEAALISKYYTYFTIIIL